jgi:hypothetical protein
VWPTAQGLHHVQLVCRVLVQCEVEACTGRGDGSAIGVQQHSSTAQGASLSVNGHRGEAQVAHEPCKEAHSCKAYVLLPMGPDTGGWASCTPL